MSYTPQEYMLRATLVSLYCNAALVCIKVTALLLVNSLAIAVDLGVSIVALMVSIVLYYSIRLANRPVDIMHNYGYGKVEHVCEAMEGVVMLGIALAMSSQALMNIMHHSKISLPWVGALASCVNLTLNFGGAIYILKMAKKSHSPAIHAEGIHYILEGVISSVIGLSFMAFMSLNAQGKGHIAVFVDPLAALLVSAMLVVPSIKLAKKSFFNLLDASVDEDGQLAILKKLGQHIDKYCEFKDLKTRTAGRHKFVELKLVGPETMSFKKGHEIATSIEDDIRTAIPNCEIMIKMEPCKGDCDYAKNLQDCPYLATHKNGNG